MLISKRYGLTECERTRFVETRNFIVASIVINFKDKNIIEVGGLNIPILVQIVKAASYTACVNKDYADSYHQSHKEILLKFKNLDYITSNFEEYNFSFSNQLPIIVYSSNTIEHVQDIEAFLAKIRSLGESVTAYLTFGPIRSHSFYGHHSSYEITELPLAQQEIDAFHLLPQRVQFRIAKAAYKRIGIEPGDVKIMDIIAKSNLSSKQMLNNLTLGDYYREFHLSELYIAKIDLFRDLSYQKGISKLLYSFLPHIGDISARNMTIILAVDIGSFRRAYPYLSSSLDPSLSHWLQPINVV